MEVKVRKRNGDLENFNAEKINQVLNWAVEDIAGVNASDIAVNAKLNLFDGITSSQIHDILIDSATDLISEENVNYSKVAARLLNYKLRKDVWKGKNAPKFYDLVINNINKGFYDPKLLEWYSEDDFHKFDEVIDHSRDFIFEYAGLKQLCEKYLVQNRSSAQIYETPQFAYMLISMLLFSNEKNGERKRLVKEAYHAFSKHKVNLSTPIMAGARTRTRSFASCCIIEVDDTKDSLFASNTAAGLATCDKYGIGLNMSKIRAIQAPIRNGETLHTGVIPWLKMYQATIRASLQGGSRRGAGTVTFPIFHYEIEDIVQLKNNTGTEENRVRHLDYSISISRIFYERFLNNESITLFSSHEVRDLFDCFGLKEFDDLYVKYEQDPSIKFKKQISAKVLFQSLIKQRVETGRIYILNVDEANNYCAWNDIVQMSNLCQEYISPTIPLSSPDDENGEIGTCILSAVNMLKVESDKDHERICSLLVRMLDNLIDIQDYFLPAAEKFTKNKRSLGIGITNLAGWLASKGLNHCSKEAPEEIDIFMEKQQYFLLKASNQLAQERGKCKDYSSSKYSKNISPLDRYNKNVDEVVKRKPNMDWNKLMNDIKEFGLRHCTLSMCMPCESSSIIQGTTNGVEPIRSLITYKDSKTSPVPVLAPSIKKWKNKYAFAFEMENNNGIINCVAIINKWVDMGVSGNLYSPKGKISLKNLLQDIFTATKLGWRTFYYHNTDDEDSQNDEEDKGCAGGACTL